MSAVIGGDETELLAKLEQFDLQPANFNGGGQIVVAGALDGLAQLQESRPRAPASSRSRSRVHSTRGIC